MLTIAQGIGVAAEGPLKQHNDFQVYLGSSEVLPGNG